VESPSIAVYVIEIVRDFETNKSDHRSFNDNAPKTQIQQQMKHYEFFIGYTANLASNWLEANKR
jgi:hypothetical protein